MNRLLLLLSLTLLTTACQKEASEAEPKLDGTWLVESMEWNVYNADGSERSKSGRELQTRPLTYTFTSSTLAVGGTPPYTFNYKLDGQNLTLYPTYIPPSGIVPDPSYLNITHLTKKELTLQERVSRYVAPDSPPPPTTITFIHLVRQ